MKIKIWDLFKLGQFHQIKSMKTVSVIKLTDIRCILKIENK